MKVSFKDILEKEAESRFKKLAAKLPEWAAADGIIIPSALSVEQCSGSSTAAYKAGLLGGAGLVVDLTGGLGADSMAFSKVAGRVIYNERDSKLADAARENFKRLGCENIEVCCGDAENFPIPEHTDAIYLDPARRSPTGKKVFLPEDCSPNILELKDRLLEKAPKVLVKLSPMADVTLLVRRFGECLSEMHILGVGGECKEILCILERGHAGECRFTISEGNETLTFIRSSIPSAVYGTVRVGDILAEPCAALVKAGCGGLICERYGLARLDKNTELYLSSSPESLPKDFFNVHTVNEIVPFNGKSIAETGRRLPRCEISAKNIPMSSDELRKRMKSNSGGDVHVFACTNCGERIMLVCKK